jgi:hypothetical protein
MGESKKEEQEIGKRIEGWEEKIQRQGGKCRGEETDGMDRRKWMGGIQQGPWTI